MSEWPRVRLADVMRLDIDQAHVDPSATYPLVGVLNRGRGLLYREPMAGSETKYKTLNRVGPGQVVYSRLKAFEGAITVAPDDLTDAYASQEFPTFTCGPDLLSGYFALLTSTSHLWDDLQNLSTGMGGRRERVKPADFLTLRLPLPSVRVQRRIIDVMAAVDAQIKTQEEEANAAAVCLSAACVSLTAPDACEAVLSLPEAAEILDRLRVPLNESERAGRPGDVPYYGANGQVGWIDSAIFDEPLVLMAEDGGPVEDWRARPQAYAVAGPAWVNNHAHVLRATRVPHEWLLYSLRHRDLTRIAAGATRPKLTQTGLKSLRIGVPDDMERRLAILTALDEVSAALAAEVKVLRGLRSALLQSLLSQSICIPESYDALLEPAS